MSGAAALALVCALAGAGAATGTIRGQVVDDAGGVPFANVLVLGTRIGTMADTCGRFELRGVPC